MEKRPTYQVKETHHAERRVSKHERNLIEEATRHAFREPVVRKK